MDDQSSFSLGFTQGTPVCLNPQPTQQDPKRPVAIRCHWSGIDSWHQSHEEEGSILKDPNQEKWKKRRTKSYPLPNIQHYQRRIFNLILKKNSFSKLIVKCVDFCWIYLEFIHNCTLTLFFSYEIRCIRTYLWMS